MSSTRSNSNTEIEELKIKYKYLKEQRKKLDFQKKTQENLNQKLINKEHVVLNQYENIKKKYINILMNRKEYNSKIKELFLKELRDVESMIENKVYIKTEYNRLFQKINENVEKDTFFYNVYDKDMKDNNDGVKNRDLKLKLYNEIDDEEKEIKEMLFKLKRAVNLNSEL